MLPKPLAVLKGAVLHGKGRGRGFGFPTANVQLSVIDPIPFGVYFSRVIAQNGERYFAVTNVGVHPTVGKLDKPLAEVHLFDVSDEWYGQVIEIELLRFLRPEQAFESVEALKARVQADVEQARAMIKEKSV